MDYGSGTTVFDMVFPNLIMGENSVLCPFHHDVSPSMRIDTTKKIFHCFGCGAHGTENDFIQQYYKIGREQVTEFKEVLLKSDSLEDYENFARKDDAYTKNYTYLELRHLGISEELLEDCKVGLNTITSTDDETGDVIITPDTSSSYLVFPIIIGNRILDQRSYTMDKSVLPKSRSKPGVKGGLVLPHHLWFNDMRPTVICEGEKDMLFARQNGFNAISLGGCNNIPTTLLEHFKGD